MPVHVRYKSLYISSPPSANPQREMTSFQVVLTTGPTRANVPYFYLELNVVVAYSAVASFNTDKHTE